MIGKVLHTSPKREVCFSLEKSYLFYLMHFEFHAEFKVLLFSSFQTHLVSLVSTLPHSLLLVKW